MYSKWHKIDLHIHSDKSKETKSNDYHGIFSIDTLLEKLKANEVEMISLTDHNIVNNCAYEELFKRDIAVLIGIEFDISINENDLVAYIKKIKDNEDQEKIKNKPFHALIIFKSKDYKAISNKTEKMYVNISKTILKNEIDLSLDKTLRVTTFKNIVEHYKDEDFFVIAHGNKDKGIVTPYKECDKLEDAQYEFIIGEISALEMKSNIKLQHIINKYNEGFQNLIKNGFNTVDTTSYVVFSDNHNSNEYEPREIQTWIKGGVDYETLRLAFSDPNSRIHTSKKKPTHTANYIDKIELKLHNSDLQNIHFSPYLNVIIGGRSSGKSLLFNTLISLNRNFDTSTSSLFNEIYKRYVDQNNTKVSDNMGNYSNTFNIDGEAYYQERIISLFDEESDLKNKLEEMFVEYDHEEIKNAESDIESVFDQLCKSYKHYYDSYFKIEKGNIAKLLKDSLKKNNKLFEIQLKALVTIDTKQYSEINQDIEEILNQLNTIKNKKIFNTNIFTQDELKQIEEVLNVFDNKQKEISNTINRLSICNKFFEKITKIKDEYNRNELDQEKQQIEYSKKKLEDDLKDYKLYFKNKKILNEKCKNIENINFKVEDKINHKGKYSFITKLNFQLNKDIIISEFFEEVIKDYESSKSIFANLINMADKTTALRIKQKTRDGKTPESFNNKINDFVISKKSKIQYEIIENGKYPISSSSTSQGKKASMFLDIKLNTFLENIGKHILLIDQIEDNIDNKYIGLELVELIRKLKNIMQIIIVTHNPSIAIYGDAENIIIADNDNSKISFKQGGLETEDIRKEACKILDGGDIAFKNRMEKYNIAKHK